MTMIQSTDPKEFFIWVDPEDWLVQHSIGVVGGIPAPPPPKFTTDDLLFVHNPNHKMDSVSRFHTNIIRDYRIEYDMERYRSERHPDLPSRLFALYLFEDRDQASKYHKRQPAHVGRRVLKRGLTTGPYVYSLHDSAWIDFLRLSHSMDVDTFNTCWRGYWSGQRMEEAGKFISMGKTWEPISIVEALFYGRVTFPNKNVSVFD